MPPFNHRRKHPSPEVKHQNVYFDDDSNLGTGTFTVQLTNKQIDRNTEIAATVLNPGRFQITLQLHATTRRLSATLGRGDNRPPTSLFESDTDLFLGAGDQRRIVVTFNNWQIIQVTIGGKKAIRKEEGDARTSQRLFPQWREEAVTDLAVRRRVFSLTATEVHDQQELSESDKAIALTCIEFDLPYAVSDIQGSLPISIPFPQNRPFEALVTNRQKPGADIGNYLGPPPLGLLPGWVWLCRNDRHGIVNTAKIQFQFKGYIPVDDRGSIFGDCIRWFNRFMEHYRKVTERHEYKKIDGSDVVTYSFAHVCGDRLVNRIIEPSTRLTITASPGFPNDQIVWGSINSSGQVKLELWERLLLEARHYLATNDYRIAVVNAITALENLLQEKRAEKLKAFFSEKGIPLNEWKNNSKLESITTCLNITHVLRKNLSLPDGITERLLTHYNLRNSIVHNGTLTVDATKAASAIDDVYTFSRHLTLRFDFSLMSIFRPESGTADSVNIRLISVTNKDRAAIKVEIVNSTIAISFSLRGNELLHISTPFPTAKWVISERTCVVMSYSHRNKTASVILNTELLSQVKCDLPPEFDSATFHSESFDEHLMEIASSESPFFGIHSRAVAPSELAGIDSFYETKTSMQAPEQARQSAPRPHKTK